MGTQERIRAVIDCHKDREIPDGISWHPATTQTESRLFPQAPTGPSNIPFPPNPMAVPAGFPFTRVSAFSKTSHPSSFERQRTPVSRHIDESSRASFATAHREHPQAPLKAPELP